MAIHTKWLQLNIVYTDDNYEITEGRYVRCFRISDIKYVTQGTNFPYITMDNRDVFFVDLTYDELMLHV